MANLVKKLMEIERKPPFSRSSRGLGLDFCTRKFALFKRGFVTLNGQKVAIPRYFRDKLGFKAIGTHPGE